MGSPPPTPPIVTLFPHGTVTDYGTSSSRTFWATVTQPATITFYFDGVAQAPTFGQIASFPCINQETHHVIRVVASNANGSSEDLCDWYVEDEPCVPHIVERVSPSTEFVIDAIGESRTFTTVVTADPLFPPAIGLYLNETFIAAAASELLTATAGTHTVKVVASGCGIQEISWTWYVPATPASDPQHTSPVYQRPVVTKVSPTTDNLGMYRMNNSPPVLAVRVNQPALLTLKIDDVVVDTKAATQIETDVTFEQCPDFIAYMKVASHLGTHTVSIVAENSNGISDPVTWQWTLIIAIDQAAIEFEAMPNYVILGYEFEARMNDMPFFNAASFSSPGDHKLLIPGHAYTNKDHTMKKGAIALHRDFWENSIHRFIAFIAYMWDSDGGSRCNEPDDPPDPCWVDPDGRVQYDCMKLTCDMTHTMRLDLRDRSVLKACATDDQGIWRCVRKLPVTSDESIVNIDFMSEIQWIYGTNGELPFPTADLSGNEIVLTWIRVKKIDEPEGEQEKTLRPNICLKLRYSSDENPLDPNPQNPQQGTFGARLIWTRREVQGSPGEEEFVVNFGIIQ